MKNIDYLKSMNIEELAKKLAYFSTCEHCVYSEEDCVKKIFTYELDCEEGIKKWLELEHTEI